MKFPSFLRIAIVPKLGTFEVNISSKGDVKITGGVEGKFVELLSAGLQFRYKLLIPTDKEWGRLKEDGSWTGAVGMVHRGEADLAVSKISITEQKSTVVGFSYPYSIETLTFATGAPGVIPKTSAIFYPFSFQTWICLALLLIAIPMLFCKFMKKKYSIVSLAFRVYGTLLHQELLLKVKAVSDKLLLGSWLWGAMILSLCYTTLLLSFLTVPVKEKGVQTIDELAAAASRGLYKCMTYQGSSTIWILQNSKTDSVRSIGESILKNNGLIKLNSNLLPSQILTSKRVALIGPENDFRIVSEDQIFISKDSFALMFWSIVIPKNFCCKRKLDSFVHKVYAASLYDKILNDNLFRARLKYARNKPSEQRLQLSLDDISGAFIFLISGYLLASFALIFEFCYKKTFVVKKQLKCA